MDLGEKNGSKFFWNSSKSFKLKYADLLKLPFACLSPYVVERDPHVQTQWKGGPLQAEERVHRNKQTCLELLASKNVR